MGAKCLSLAGAGGLSLLLSGCAMSTVSNSAPAPVQISASAVQGKVLGGQQPVANVALQLYAVSSAGYGGPSMPLLTPGAAKTDANGNFTLPSFTCPVDNPNVYLVGTGGTPFGSTANPNLALMVGLGTCSSLSSIPFVDMNELTTIATVYSVSGFMTGITNIGAPASNLAGITKAFAAINKVVNINLGTVSGTALPIGATLPTSEIGALGNILQNCVNSAGGSASDTTDGQTNGTPCGKLFYLTSTSSPPASAAPTDTITATMNIAQHPGNNVAKLNDLQASSPAFYPHLNVNSPPTDWTVAINYTGGGLSTPQSIANDASGNVWITNKGNNSVTKLDNSGAAISSGDGLGGGSLNVPYGIAIDTSGSPWITNSGNNTLTKLDASGANPSVYSANGLNTPEGVAIDGAGNVWVANNASGANSVSAFTSAGTPLTGSPYTGAGISGPQSIAINPK
jgi:hypothetical protein